MTKSSSKALERVEAAQQGGERGLTLYDRIENQKDQIARALPRTLNIDADYFIRVALNYAKDPTSRIHQCHPTSVLAGLMDAAGLGLTLDGVRGQAYLIPRRIKGTMVANFQVGYRGYIDLAARAGITVEADAVRDGDKLEYQKGSNPQILHVPSLDGDENEESIVAFYAVAQFADGRPPRFDIKSRAWMEQFRDKFASDKRDNAAWWQHFEAMGNKTMIRRLLNQLPTTVEIRQAIEKDTTGFQGVQVPIADAPASTVDALDDRIEDVVEEDEDIEDAELVDDGQEEEQDDEA